MITSISHGEVLQIKMSRYPDFPPATWVCAYLVDGLLIDTGPSYTAEELRDFLKEKGLKLAVNTHFHEDHISANKFLQDAYKVDIFAPALAIDKINKPASLYPYQEEVWGYPVPSQVKPLGNYIQTEKYRFDVIPTPSHDGDHICLYEDKNGWLFTGDLYVSTRPLVCRPNEDLWQTLADLRKMRSLNPRSMFPAPTHVIAQPMEKLDKAIAYLMELGNRVDALYNKGMPPEQIMQEIFGAESMLAELTQNQFSSLNMVKSFLRKYE
jgi:glyoxylase-like metal-dependent hydrolase (beta-lactamase superfamily II)